MGGRVRINRLPEFKREEGKGRKKGRGEGKWMVGES